MNTYIETTCKNAKNSFYEFNKLEPERINNTLQSLIKDLLKNKSEIFKANKKDIKNAYKKNIKDNLIERLILNDKKINYLINSIKEIIKLYELDCEYIDIVSNVERPIRVLGKFNFDKGLQPRTLDNYEFNRFGIDERTIHITYEEVEDFKPFVKRLGLIEA